MSSLEPSSSISAGSSGGGRPGSGEDPDDLVIVPRRQLGTWVLAAAVVIVVGSLLASLLRNPNLQLEVIGEYLFSAPILSGVRSTLELTALAMVIGVAGGVVIALMRLSRNPVLRAIANTYVWFFRGTPILVQLLFWGFLGAFYEHVGFGIPFTGDNFVEYPTESLLSPFVAAVLGLALNEAAYSSEVVRAGILSVGREQVQAAKALGMTGGQTMRRIIMPQAMVVIVPPLGNLAILMLKTTSLVSVIGGADLLTEAQQIYQQNFKTIPLLVVATLWYLAMVSVMTLGQRQLERRFGRGMTTVGVQ
ncbi:MAG TPA: amino acid ABC transporter permease [Solirubrobacter sp.]|nr:amino acid ABC transporter permease [Solirubrobacter sp.]